jgi:nucleoside 2-deoxyribosyltransferase
MIDVVGGVYLERCVQPRWHQLYGSAGRAAAALSAQTDVILHTYVDDISKRELEARVASFKRASLSSHPIARTISFDYVHPLSVPVILPAPQLLKHVEPIEVEADTVLRFGMLEGDAIVRGKTVVYDPQSANTPSLFGANGSRATRLAVVANAYEIRLLSGLENVEDGARWVLAQDNAEVVVVKRGSEGALVFTASSRHEVPAFRTQLVFSIGSGDIFASAFALFWAVQGLAPEEAAELASRSTAMYCESRSAPLLTAQELRTRSLAAVHANKGRVYLAGPFFCLKERWMVEEARSHLLGMRLEVFSPLHDVGPGPANVVAPADLAALDRCDRVLALLDGADPGTLFEVGYARAKGLPVFVLSETLTEEQLKMIDGSGCVRTDDFATAIYLTAWG